MGMNVNGGTNLNSIAIFNSLDIKDGNSDGKIDVSIWNKFADEVGGMHIKNYIESKNAIKSIEYCIKRGGDAIKEKICKFLGYDTETANNNLSDADKVMQAAFEQKDDLKIEYGIDDQFGVALPCKTAKVNVDGKDAIIKVIYDDKTGEISQIVVNTKLIEYEEHDGYGKTEFKWDRGEVNFNADGAYVEGENENDEIRNNDYEYIVTQGYDFEKYKQMAEAIFGKD